MLAAAILLPLVFGWLFLGGGLERVWPRGGGSSLPADVGQPAPAFRLGTADGSQLGLADRRGKVVLINFWATWCVPCRTEMPEIEQAYRTYASRGFAVLAVDVQETADQVRPFMAELNLSFPALLDLDGAVSRAYFARALPSSFVVDRQGIVRYVKVGPLTTDVLREQIEKLL